MIEFNLLQKITVWILPVLFAITVHEVAHGWVANRLGDPTARMLGRLTLNPFKHIDPVGTILVPAITLLLANLVFGYAKPVPVTYQNLRHPKRDMALVALAGPVSNLLMALLWVLVIRAALLLPAQTGSVALFLVATGVAGIFANLLLMLFNLIPLPPLDGGRVMTGILPGPYAVRFARLEPYGLMILVLLMVTGLLSLLQGPLFWMLQSMAELAGVGKSLVAILYALGVLRM